MAHFILDEWLWSDLRGENRAGNPKAQSQSFALLEKIFEICDKIVIVEGSAFSRKLWSLSKEATDPVRRGIVKYFKDKFLYNPNKVVKLNQDDLVAIDQSLAAQTQTKDHYLIQAHLAYRESVIVTTDSGLESALRQHNIPCEHRNTFIERYTKAPKA